MYLKLKQVIKLYFNLKLKQVINHKSQIKRMGIRDDDKQQLHIKTNDKIPIITGEGDKEKTTLFIGLEDSLKEYTEENVNQIVNNIFALSNDESVVDEDGNPKTLNKEEPTKLRLVKNHVQRIVRHYTNGILNAAPGVRVFPYNESELQDQKTAELNQSVWEDAIQKQDLKRKIKTWFC